MAIAGVATLSGFGLVFVFGFGFGLFVLVYCGWLNFVVLWLYNMVSICVLWLRCARCVLVFLVVG